MKISVVVCTRNRAVSLECALQKYFQWKQRDDWELVIVDNASTDDTAKVIAKAASELPQLKTVVEKKIGLGAARNLGWRTSTGSIVVFTDDDCYPDSHLLDAYLSLFNERKEIGFAGGRILLWDASDVALTVDYRDQFHLMVPNKFIPTGVLQGANMAFRRDVLVQTGGFDSDLGAGTPFPCEDIDIIARASLLYRMGCFDPRAVIYHHHRRKEADRAAIVCGYDKGRGAYYAKFLLRKDTRKAYWHLWYATIVYNIQRSITTRNWILLKTPLREIQYAIKYIFYIMRKEYFNQISGKFRKNLGV